MMLCLLLAAGIPQPLQDELRRYGPLDLKVDSAVYEDYALAALQSVGSRAGVPLADILQWAKATKPSPAAFDQLHLGRKFLDRDPDLETLLAMAEVDERLLRVAPDFTWMAGHTEWPRRDPGLSAQRWAAYRKLFASAGVPEGFFRTRDFQGAVFFIARATGSLLNGSGAGYAHSADELPARSGDTTFHEVEPQWYVWYENDKQPH